MKRDYKIIPEGIITKFNTLKMRELQLEHLVSTGVLKYDELPKINEMLSLFPQKEWTFSEEDFRLLETCCDNCVKVLTAAIPQAFLDEWELGDSKLYTQTSYGSLFWNEIELPPLTRTHFNVFEKIIKGNSLNSNISAQLCLYDMSDNCLEFTGLGELEAFIDHVQCEPATVFEADFLTGVFHEAYSI